MYDHEIRDVMRRGALPNLQPGYACWLDEETGEYEFSLFVRNEGAEPAIYYIVDIGVDARLGAALTLPQWDKLGGQMVVGGRSYYTFQRGFMPPSSLPIFKPRPYQLAKFRIAAKPDLPYLIHLSVSCPGYHGTWRGDLLVDGVKGLWDFKEQASLARKTA